MKKLALFLVLCLLLQAVGISALAGEADETPAATVTLEAKEPTAEEPVEEPKQEEPVEEPKQDEPVEEPKQDEPVEEPKQEEPVEEPKQDEPVEEPKQDEPVEEPKQEEPVEEPKQEEPVEEPKQEEPVEEPKQEEPAEEPVTEPTEKPTTEPTEEPTAEPTEEPTTEPTAEPTEEPTTEPTEEPTEEPAEETAEEAESVDEEAEDLEEAAPEDFVIRDDGTVIQYNGVATSITLPEVVNGITVTRLSEAVFANNTVIQNVTLPPNITLDAGAFRNCTGLLSANISNIVPQIPAECFENCSALLTVAWPQNLWSIGHDAFSGCTALTGIPQQNSITVIGDNAFKNCTALTYADLSTSLWQIGQGAFAGCTSLREIVIPDSVTDIGNHAFENCTAVTKLKLSANLTIINNYCFSGCSSIPSITIPDGVTEIGREAFYGCSSATIIRIPASVIQIGNNAFYGTPSGKWVRWDNCASNAYIGTDGLGVSGYVLAPVNSPAHVYCNNHSGVYFCSTLARDFIERCYNNMLGRASDEPGLLSWCAQVATGAATGASLVKSFTDSVEFRNMGLTYDGVVETLYQTMLSRASDPAGLAYWVDFLNSGLTKDFIINGFSKSVEFAGLCNAYKITAGEIALTNPRDKNAGVTKFVARCYTEALQRQFDTEGLEGWVTAILTNRRTPAEVARGFIFSKEFTDKNLNDSQFVDRLYHTYFDRVPDAPGMMNWLAVLAQGYTREFVNAGFAKSDEFYNLLKSYGLVK